MSGGGTLYGVGLGPGDPELVTVKAARLIGAADVVAYHCARHGRSVARSIAEPYLRDGQVEEPLVYPVTTEATDHPGGYEGAMEEFYAARRRPADGAPGRRARRRAARRGRPALLQQLHAHAQADQRPVPDRDRARRHLGQRRVGRARPCPWSKATTC